MNLDFGLGYLLLTGLIVLGIIAIFLTVVTLMRRDSGR